MAVQLKKRSRHPSTIVMVCEAITFLEQRNGSSISAIKKFMSHKYDVDCVHLAPYIKKAIKSAIEDGQLKQFKMSYKLSKKPVRKATTSKSNSKIVKSAGKMKTSMKTKPSSKKISKINN